MSRTSDDIAVRVHTLATLLTRQQQRVATAESCTGGLIAGALTALAGSSAWFERGWVTYSNDAKAQELGIDPVLIATHGAVSETVAVAMAEGARRSAATDFALSVTGIAGPGGGTPQKPVGTVCLVGRRRRRRAQRRNISAATGSRFGSSPWCTRWRD